MRKKTTGILDEQKQVYLMNESLTTCKQQTQNQKHFRNISPDFQSTGNVLIQIHSKDGLKQKLTTNVRQSKSRSKDPQDK